MKVREGPENKNCVEVRTGRQTDEKKSEYSDTLPHTREPLGPKIKLFIGLSSPSRNI